MVVGNSSGSGSSGGSSSRSSSRFLEIFRLWLKTCSNLGHLISYTD